MPEFIDNLGTDFLSRATVLRTSPTKRTNFDPTNDEHRASLANFLETGNWGSVQFFTEYPYTDVPMTVLTKLARHHLFPS